MPADFGPKWVAWQIWDNAISILMVLQGIASAVTLDPTLVPHNYFHWALIANAVLALIVAQVKRQQAKPPEPPK